MAGLYPDNTQAIHDWISAGSNPTGYNLTWVDAKDNFINRLSETSCPLFDVVHQSVKGSQNWKDAREFYYDNYN
jgi:hypothetical protein